MARSAFEIPKVCLACGEVTPSFMKVSRLHQGDCPAIRSAFDVPDPLDDDNERDKNIDWNDVTEETEEE